MTSSLVTSYTLLLWKKLHILNLMYIIFPPPPKSNLNKHKIQIEVLCVLANNANMATYLKP